MKQHTRRFQLTAFAAVLLLVLTGCGGNSSVIETAEQTQAETTAAEQSTTQETTNDTTHAVTTTTASDTTTAALSTASAAAESTQTQPPVVQTQPPVTQTQPPVIQTQPPVVQTQPPVIQTQPVITTASTGSTRNAARIRTDWCRLMSASHSNMVIVKDNTGYYMQAQSGSPDSSTVVTAFDASDLIQVYASMEGIFGLSQNGTVRRINSTNYYWDSYYAEALADWTDIAFLTSVRGSILCGVKTDGTVVTASYQGSRKEEAAETLSAWRNVKQMDGGVAICSDGSMLAYGFDDYLFMPYLQTIAGAAQAECAYTSNTLHFLTQDGRDCTLYEYGKVRETAKNVAYIGGEGLRIYNDGTLFCYSNSIDNYGEITTWTDLAAACAGNYGIIARKSDGTYLFAGAAKAFEPYVN